MTVSLSSCFQSKQFKPGTQISGNYKRSSPQSPYIVNQVC